MVGSRAVAASRDAFIVDVCLPLGNWTAQEGPGGTWSSGRRGLMGMGPWSLKAPSSIPGEQGLISWSLLPL